MVISHVGYKRTTVLEKSLKAVRYQDNFRYLEMTFTLLSSSVNLKNKQRILTVKSGHLSWSYWDWHHRSVR